MSLVQFSVSGVLQVDLEQVGVAAANALYGSDDPANPAYEHGFVLRDDPMGSLKLLLEMAVLDMIAERFASTEHFVASIDATSAVFAPRHEDTADGA
jgi:hypothetical protein